MPEVRTCAVSALLDRHADASDVSERSNGHAAVHVVQPLAALVAECKIHAQGRNLPFRLDGAASRDPRTVDTPCFSLTSEAERRAWKKDIGVLGTPMLKFRGNGIHGFSLAVSLCTPRGTGFATSLPGRHTMSSDKESTFRDGLSYRVV